VLVLVLVLVPLLLQMRLVAGKPAKEKRISETTPNADNPYLSDFLYE
jgi:hypothetical protein